MSEILHTLKDGFCTVCGETEEWMREHGYVFIDASEGSEFVVGDVLQQGAGVRRWLVTHVHPGGEAVSLRCLRGKGEGNVTEEVAPGVFFNGLSAQHPTARIVTREGLERYRLAGHASPLPANHSALRER